MLTGITALYFTLVALNNIVDYGTNKQFVEHGLAMDTTFNDPDVMWRSIESPTAVTIAYVAVIAWETPTAAVLSIAFFTWVRRGQGENALRLSVLGWIMVVLLFRADSSASAASGSRCGSPRRGTVLSARSRTS